VEIFVDEFRVLSGVAETLDADELVFAFDLISILERDALLVKSVECNIKNWCNIFQNNYIDLLSALSTPGLARVNGR
jgi:hypothetical protein